MKMIRMGGMMRVGEMIEALELGNRASGCVLLRETCDCCDLRFR
jgi:hypothetical protein